MFEQRRGGEQGIVLTHERLWSETMFVFPFPRNAGDSKAYTLNRSVGIRSMIDALKWSNS